MKIFKYFHISTAAIQDRVEARYASGASCCTSIASDVLRVCGIPFTTNHFSQYSQYSVLVGGCQLCNGCKIVCVYVCDCWLQVYFSIDVVRSSNILVKKVVCVRAQVRGLSLLSISILLISSCLEEEFLKLSLIYKYIYVYAMECTRLFFLKYLYFYPLAQWFTEGS